MKGEKFYVPASLPNKNYHRNIAILLEPLNQKSSHQVKSRRFPGFFSRHQVLTSYVIQQPINHQLINLSTYQPINLSTYQPILRLSTSKPINLSTHQPINLAYPFEISAKFLSPKRAKQFR